MKTVDEWNKEIEQLISSKNHQEAARLRAGVEFARKAHAGDFRKSTNEPYIVHPLEVCTVVATVTDDVDVLIAALLHDVVEDTSYTAEDIQKEFGPRVTGFVADESEDKMEDIPKAMSWLIRKEKFLEHLAKAPIESRTICLGDKVSNLRSTLMMYELKGEAMWEVFNQKDPKRHAWYYRSIADVLKTDFKDTEAFKEYARLFHKIFGSTLNWNMSSNGGLIMVINERKAVENEVYVEVSGRITSSNAEDFFGGAQAIIDAHPGCTFIYDLDELEMISSAGLRVFLRLKKAGVSFKIINANAEVYDVFDMTGFVQMFDIKKAYRKMSVEGCTQIGEGAKGIVYKIDDETIIKVYKDSDCMEEIIQERECAKKALVMGVPTAIPFDIVLVGDKFGSVFELVAAKSVTKSIIAEPEKTEEYVRGYADIMKEMHTITDNGELGIELPSIKDEVKVWADFTKDYVSDEIYGKIQEFASSLEDSRTLLHGDGHPNNVMCTRDGMIFIDMDTLCVGDQRADVAVVYTALVGYKVVDPGNEFIPVSLDKAKEIWNIYINEYCLGMSEEEIEEFELWCKKFTYLRLYRRGVRKEKDKPHFAENAKRELEALFS